MDIIGHITRTSPRIWTVPVQYKVLPKPAEKAQKRNSRFFSIQAAFFAGWGDPRRCSTGVYATVWTTETTEKLSMFEFDGWKTVFQTDNNKQSEAMLTSIRNHDLYACEAQYSKNCQRDCVKNPTDWRTSNNDVRQRQTAPGESHSFAFH